MLFPPVLILGNLFFDPPVSLFAVLFFLSSFWAATPYIQKRAPFGYWALVCCAWMGMCFFGAIILLVVFLIFGLPFEG